MKILRVITLVLPVTLLGTLPTTAQAASGSSLNLDTATAPSRNRFGLSYRAGFNAPVTFKNAAPVQAPTLVRPTLDGDSYNYDNGYVLTDSSGNALGFTRYWGYDTADQFTAQGTIVMQRSLSVATGESGHELDEPFSGFEMTYDRELLRKESWRGGLESAFGYSYTSVDENTVEAASVTRLTDSYVFPQGSANPLPPAPYMGRFSLPGPVLTALPATSTTVVAQDASFSGRRSFSADLFGFRFGPYVEVPVSKSIALTLGGGFALVYVSSDFSFNQTVTQGGVSGAYVGSGSHNEWLPGGYVAGNVSVALSDRWSLVGGAQFQDVGRYKHKENGSEAILDLRSLIFVSLGLTYSF